MRNMIFFAIGHIL